VNAREKHFQNDIIDPPKAVGQRLSHNIALRWINQLSFLRNRSNPVYEEAKD
jgi:hypothetical protein